MYPLLLYIGMLHIVLAFPVSYLFVQGILQIGPLGILNFMSLFIILVICSCRLYALNVHLTQLDRVLLRARLLAPTMFSSLCTCVI